MNYRCPKSDCAGSTTPLPEAMAQAMGMKCPVCQSELQADVQVVESADKTIESGPWVDWPTPISLPLCEYFEEEHPGAKLWAACDAFEMLTRLLVIALVGSRAKGGELEDGLRDRLSRLIESPTFGAWYVMARELSDVKGFSEDLSAARDFVLGSLKDLLYGPDNPGTDETSFLKLRNRLAHGGGMTRKEQSRLLDLWQERVEETIDQLEWMSVWELLGRSENGEWKKLTGNEQETIPAPDGVGDTESDSVWLRVNNSLYPLWPLAAFGKPSIQGEGKQKKGSTEATQVYSRKESVRLGYVPLGVEGMGHAESSSSALAAFEYMFRPSEKAQASSFKIKDFMGEIRKDAGQMVGRQAELEEVKQKIREHEQGVLWISGQAGMGKSFFTGKLCVDLRDEFAESGPLVLSYRMRAGDQDRCSRDAFATFVIERMEAAGLVRDDLEINPREKSEKQLDTCLGALKKEASVILVVDGLDEVARRDGKFTEEVPLALRYPGVLWICSGRPEPMITEPIRKLGGEDLFPHGLPPMREEDVRGMILEKIGPLRKKLLGKDDEQDGKVINPFIRLVTERAAGLPLYVKYVIGDVLGGKYRVLDGEEELPDSLHSYHEELLRRLGVGDLQAVVTPLAAILATAYEPLSVRELVAILVHRKLLTEQGARQMVEKGLAAIASMVRSAPDPEGEVGYCLFHQSLRDHMTGSDQMTHSIATAREAFADLTEREEQPHCLRNYLLRCGIDHLLEVGRKEGAERLLLDLDHLYAMNRQKIDEITFYRYWEELGGESRSMQYRESVDKTLKDFNDKDSFAKADLAQSLADVAHWKNLRAQLAEKILESKLAKLGQDHPYVAISYNHLGEAYLSKGEFDRGIEYHEKSLKIQLAKLGQDHPDVARSYNHLGFAYLTRGEFDRGIEYLEKSLEIMLAMLGQDHPDVAVMYSHLGIAHLDKGENDRAFEYLEIALKIRLAKLGQDHPDVAKSYNSLGSAYRSKGEFDRAIEYLEKALKIMLEKLGQCHPSVGRQYGILGSSYLSKREFDRGIEYKEKSLEIELTKLGQDHPDVARSYNDLGLNCTKAKDFEKALKYLSKVAEICMDEEGKFSFQDAPVIGNYGHALGMCGETEKGVSFSHFALKCKLEQEVPRYSSIQKSYQKLTEIFEHSGNEGRAQENEAMAKWSELRSEGRFLDEIDSVEFEKEVGISHEWARQIEEDIINSK